MNLLAFETAADPGSVALLTKKGINCRVCPTDVSNSATLLPLCETLMHEAGVSFSQLDAVAFGAGPGAFTGLRVACGVAQGVAMAYGLPMVAVSSLEAMAAACGEPRVLSLLDARMGEIYCACYETGVLQGKICLCRPEALPLPTGTGWTACGNALTAYPLLREHLVSQVSRWRPEVMPSADFVARLAAARVAVGETIDPAEAVPLYVRNKVAKTIAERLAEGGKA